MKRTKEQQEGWDRGWEEHRLRQQQRLAGLPFSEKLEWLEAAQELAQALISAREKQLQRRQS